MVKVLIKRLSSDVKLPSYKTSGASGLDLMAFIKSPVTIKPKTSYLIPTGLSLAFSKDYEVHGIKRKSSSLNTERVDHIYEDPHSNNNSFFMHRCSNKFYYKSTSTYKYFL